eukprot:169976_1
MSRLLRRFDFYRQIDRDLVKPTNTGAIVSIICLLTVFYLIISEYIKFQTIDIESKIHVNTPHHYDFNAKIPIFINITIPNVACPIFGVDISDALGRFSFSHDPSKVIMHRLFYYHNTKNKMTDLPIKTILYNKQDIIKDTNGKFISESELKTMLPEGCRIEANLEIKNIPGNIHISGHSHDDLVDIWTKYSDRKSIDLSHIIHNFEIGNKSINNLLLNSNINNNNVFDKYVSFFPLNGFISITPPSFIKEIERDIRHGNEYTKKQHAGHSHGSNDIKISYEYFMKIVSSKYKFLNGNIEKEGYQFTVASHVNEQLYQTPIINFRYNPSGITIEYIEIKETFSHFIVQLFAIIGG